MNSIYIVEPGTYLRKDGGCLLVESEKDKDKDKRRIPLETVNDIVLASSAQISSELVQYLLDKKIPVVWINNSGYYLGSLQSESNVDVEKHLQQVSLLWKKTAYLEMAKKIIKAKVNNQVVVLRRYNRTLQDESVVSAIKAIYAVAKHIEFCNDYLKIMGYEGIISREYYKGFSKVLPMEFQFTKRTKRPPKDEINAMLSMGYSMLFNEMLTNVNICGLHPYIGFLHRIRKHHAALVSDLMEEWRTVIVDSIVLNMVKRKMVKKEMFRTEDGGCYFTKDGLKLFLAEYNKKLMCEVDYLQNNSTYRDLIKHQCRQYAKFVMSGDVSVYEPILMR